MNRKEELLYKILDYPVVQYITIRPYQIFSNANWKDPLTTGEPRLYVVKTIDEVVEKLKSFRIQKPLDQIQQTNKVSSDFLFIITPNAKILDIKYRTYSVVLVGQREVNALNVYKITTRDFYRESLNFMLYNEQGELEKSKVIKLK